MIKTATHIPILFSILILLSCSKEEPGGNSYRIDTTEPDFYPFTEAGLYGYIDETGNEKIAPQYEEAGFFYHNRAVIVKNGLYGYIDTTGTIVIEPVYEFAADFRRDTLAIIKQNGLYGYVGSSGNYIIEPAYVDANSFVNGLAGVSSNTGWGAINVQNQVVIPFQYEDVSYFIDQDFSLAQTTATSFATGWAIIDNTGNLPTGNTFTIPHLMIKNTSSGLSIRYIPPFFAEDNLAVLINNKASFINADEELMLETTYDFAGPFYDGLACVSDQEALGFIDINGQEVIPLQYAPSHIALFKNGYVSVADASGKFGLIDKQGNTVIPFKYDTPLEIHGHLIQFTNKTTSGYLNIGNKVIWETRL